MAPTQDALYQRAQELEIEGRSSMDKTELEAAVAEAEAAAASDDEGGSAGSAPTVRDTAEATRPVSAAPSPASGPARDLQADPDTPNGPGAGQVVKATQPDHRPDEQGYVGVDPIYRNSADQKRQPAVDGVVPGSPDDEDEDE